MTLLLIGEWFRDLTGPHQIFWGISLIFSVLFIIQFVVSLFGFDFDGEIEVDGGADVETGGLETDLTIFSLRSIIAFFTFFGWTGVLLLNNGMALGLAVTLAGVSGLLAMFIVAYMLYQFSKFSEEHTLNIEEALFQNGPVYLTIPAGKEGMGKVTLNIGKRTQELRAITDGETIKTGDKIRVIEVLDENLLLVEKLIH